MKIDYHQKMAEFLAHGFRWLKNKAVKVAKSTKKLGQDDPRRVIHSLKVGLALTLVSLLYYLRPLYNRFGASGMWAMFTVVVVFEFTVGATLSKGLNRGFATLFAGALGIGAQYLSRLFAEKAEPIVLGTLVFLITAASSFTRFIPQIKARYDYGVMIFIMTFSFVTVSGYQNEEILQLALERFNTILIGGATCIIVSIFVCPIWAGEDLHKLIASNLEKLANYLEGFGGEFFQDSENEGIVTASTGDNKALLQGYKSVLNSKRTEEIWANFARWEPGHGRFRFHHPWKQYLKIGALARQCACHIEALNGFINSDIQEPLEFRNKIRELSTKMSSESSKALKELASAIKTMTDPSTANSHVKNSKTAINDLKTTLKAATLENVDVLAIIPIASVASILIEITRCVEKISELVHELADLARFKSTVEPTVSPEKPQLLPRGKVKPLLLDGDSESDGHVVITVHGTSVQSLENEVSPVYSVYPHIKENIHVRPTLDALTGYSVVVFSTSVDGKIKLWLYDALGARVDNDAPGLGCTKMAYSAKRLFSCETSKDGQSFLIEWNENEGTAKIIYQGLGTCPSSVVQFTTIKNPILAAADNHMIKFWDMDNVELLATIDADGGLGSLSSFVLQVANPHICFNKEGTLLAVSANENRIKILATDYGLKLLQTSENCSGDASQVLSETLRKLVINPITVGAIAGVADGGLPMKEEI